MPELIHRVRNIDQIPAAELSSVDGIPYALPRTALTVTVEVRRTSTRKAILFGEAGADEAAKSLGLRGVQANNTVGYSLHGDSSGITTAQEPDPEQVYLVEVDQKIQDAQLLVALSRLGLITSAQAQVEHKSLFMAILKAVVGIAGSLLPILGGAGLESMGPARSPSVERYFKLIAGIREKREQLIAGAQPSQGLPAETLDRMLNELKALEAKYTTAFTGSKSVESWKGLFVLRPTSTYAGSVPQDLLRIAPDSHIAVLAPQVLLNPPPVEWVTPPAQGSEPERVVKLVIERETNDAAAQVGKLQRLTSATAPNNPDGRSFYYRFPAVAGVEILEEVGGASPSRRSVAQEAVAIAQFGTVCSLPRVEVTETGRYEVEWHEDIGSLKKALLIRKSNKGQGAEAVSSAAKTLIGAVDPKARLQREVDLLELQIKKKEAQEKLLEDAAIDEVLG